MNATFALEGTRYSLHLGNFCLEGHYTPGMVALSIVEQGGHASEPSAGSAIVPTKEVMGFYLKPSQARAIASAILSAATEAKA